MDEPIIPPGIDSPGATLVRRERVKVDDADLKRGLIHGQVVPYEERVELIPGVWEEFAHDTFARQAAAPDSWARVKLLFGHDDGQVPLGRLTNLTETRTGAEATFQANMRMMQETPRGQEVWLGLDSGDLDEFSVGFQSAKRGTSTIRLKDGAVLLRRLRASLMHVALVPFGAYGRSAAVQSVRDAGPVWDDWQETIRRLRGESGGTV